MGSGWDRWDVAAGLALFFLLGICTRSARCLVNGWPAVIEPALELEFELGFEFASLLSCGCRDALAW